MSTQNQVVALVQVDPEGEGLELPAYATAGAAGMDLRAAVDHEMTIEPGQRALVPTGIRIAVPPGFEAQVRPRSGLALKHGVTIPNAPGTIDADYRGPLGVIMANLGDEPFVIRRGDRIAQLVIAPVARAELEVVDKLPDSTRGNGGFGHTGVRQLTTANDS